MPRYFAEGCENRGVTPRGNSQGCENKGVAVWGVEREVREAAVTGQVSTARAAGQSTINMYYMVFDSAFRIRNAIATSDLKETHRGASKPNEREANPHPRRLAPSQSEPSIKGEPPTLPGAAPAVENARRLRPSAAGSRPVPASDRAGLVSQRSQPARLSLPYL
jgi:hypothetical protein